MQHPAAETWDGRGRYRAERPLRSWLLSRFAQAWREVGIQPQQLADCLVLTVGGAR